METAFPKGGFPDPAYSAGYAGGASMGPANITYQSPQQKVAMVHKKVEHARGQANYLIGLTSDYTGKGAGVQSDLQAIAADAIEKAGMYAQAVDEATQIVLGGQVTIIDLPQGAPCQWQAAAREFMAAAQQLQEAASRSVMTLGGPAQTQNPLLKAAGFIASTGLRDGLADAVRAQAVLRQPPGGAPAAASAPAAMYGTGKQTYNIDGTPIVPAAAAPVVAQPGKLGRLAAKVGNLPLVNRLPETSTTQKVIVAILAIAAGFVIYNVLPADTKAAIFDKAASFWNTLSTKAVNVWGAITG